jgi:2-polyprenyl-6-methoxyphenol hydroxylase-like FAD-dependent oxidoreductase
MSLVRWLKYGLDHQDISYIKPLLADNIWYSLAYSDNPGETLSKEAFLAELERRLPNHPACVSYIFRLGEIN